MQHYYQADKLAVVCIGCHHSKNTYFFKNAYLFLNGLKIKINLGAFLPVHICSSST